MYVQFLGHSGNSPDAKLVFSADLLEKLHLCFPLQRVPPLRAIARLTSTRSSGGWAKLNCRSGPIQNTEITCGVEGRSEAAHTGTDGGMSQKASDYSCVPLCADCHTQAPGAYHRAGRGTFERRNRLSFASIVARLNREWQARCA